MRGYDASTFGDRMEDYDTLDWALECDEDEASAFLASLTSGGEALELGVGTGRLALPLSKRGVPVVGVEASQAMADQLSRKLEGSDQITIVLGNFSETPSDGTFDLVYCVNHTLFSLAVSGRAGAVLSQCCSSA